jgi:hypothetical protein
MATTGWQHIPGHATLMWATTTPVQADQRAGPSNSRIDARNRIAERFIRAAGVAIDDQHTLGGEDVNDVLFLLYTSEIQLAVIVVGFEKLKFSENQYNFGDRTSLRDPNQSFVRQPDAI